MRQSRVTIRYAKALFQLVIEQDTLEQSYNDMVLLDGVCAESKELSLLLKSPIVKTDKKLKILEEIFGSKISKVTMSFINIITTKKRESLLMLIACSFITLYKTHNKITKTAKWRKTAAWKKHQNGKNIKMGKKQ